MKLAVPVPEAAAMIGISESMLWRLLAIGDIAKVKIGRRTLIRISELERFLGGHTEPEKQTARSAERPEHDEYRGQSLVSSRSPAEFLHPGGQAHG